MQRFHKPRKHELQTPKFIKKDSVANKNHENMSTNIQQENTKINKIIGEQEKQYKIDPECDFSDDMIDEHVGVSIVPVMMSPRDNLGLSQIDSLCRALTSIQNIQNVYVNNVQNGIKQQAGKKIVKLERADKKNIKSKQNRIQKINKQSKRSQNTLKSPVITHNPHHAPQPSQSPLPQPSEPKYKSINRSHNRFENIAEQLIRKQKKIQDLKEQLQQNQMKQCTFTPKCHQKGNKDKVGKSQLDQFLKKQTEYVSKIQKKKQDIRKKNQEILKAQQSFKPKINKNAHFEERNRNKKPAHERLYELNTTKNTKNNLISQSEAELKTKTKSTSKFNTKSMAAEPSSTPKQPSSNNPHYKSGMSHIPVSNSLYQDAQRRRTLLQSIEKSKQNTQNKPKIMNKTSQRYLQKKFIKQYCFILEQLGLIPTESNFSSGKDYNFSHCEEEVEDEQLDICGQSSKFNKSSKVSSVSHKDQQFSKREYTVQQFNAVLRGLGFLAYDDSCCNEMAIKQRNLAYEAFQILQQYSVNIRNICTFLLAILGIFDSNSIQFYSNVQLSNRKKQLNITQKQGRKLHTYFDLLYRNRLSINRSNHSSSQTNLRPQPEYQQGYKSRTHTEHTKNLATKYRTKMIERANQTFIQNNIDIVLPTENMLAHQDLLVIDSLGRNLEIKKLRENKNNYVDYQCTFYPKTNMGSNCRGAQTDRGIEKSKELYEHARSKHEMERHQISAFEQRSPDNKEHGISQFSQISRQNQKHDKNIKGFDQSIKGKVTPTKKSTDQIQYNASKKQQNCQVVKDMDKAVARMTLGRKQRQLKNKLLQRGQPDLSQKKQNSKSPKRTPFQHGNPSTTRTFNQYQQQINQFTNDQAIHKPPNTDMFLHSSPIFSPSLGSQTFNNENIQQSHTESMNQPFLVIDINMGQEMDQIEFYSGDERRVGEIVDEFCIDHDLDDECKEQLLQLVEVQMVRYLNNIGDSTED